MAIHHRKIPAIPIRPMAHPLAGHLNRSYPVGRQHFSRLIQGQPLSTSLTMEQAFPESLQIQLVVSLNSRKGHPLLEIPFHQCDAHTFRCDLVLDHPGLFSYRARFSIDDGVTWVSDTVPDAWVLVDPPQLDALRLYTLISTVSGSMKDWVGELVRIQSMGFNAVHLLPITTLDTSQSPYSARDLFSVEPLYLDPHDRHEGLTQLGHFVEHAKHLGMRLCFDLVLNHIGVDSQIAKHAPDWIVPDQNSPDGLKRARFWAHDGWHNWDDLVLINYEHPSEPIRSEIWSYMTDYALFWAKYAHETGGFVRFDNLHSSAVDFVKHVTGVLHTEYPDLCIQAEYFTDEHTLLDSVPNWGLNLVLATPWDSKFVPDLREYLKYLHHVSQQVRYFMPITSHDSGTPAQEFASIDATIPRYVAAALLGTGATGIPQGVEYGVLKKIEFIGVQSKIQFTEPPVFADFIRKVNDILVSHPAFRCGDNCEFVDDNHEAIIAVFRREIANPGLGYLVVCNFDIAAPQEIEIDLEPLIGEVDVIHCTDLLTDEKTLVSTSLMNLELAPCSALVLHFEAQT